LYVILNGENMKKLFGFVLLFIMCILPFSCSAESKETIHQSMHFTRIEGPMESGGCTSYSVGPNTILIAEHCLGEFPNDDLLIIDGKYAAIKEVILDGNDHALVILQGIGLDNDDFQPFLVYVEPKFYNDLKQGDKVMMWGAPLSIGCKDCYREGYYSGDAIDSDGRIVSWFAMAGGPGDSGSLIFNASGNLVGELTYGTSYGFIGSYKFGFSDEELKKVQ
jgi:hypothetical protein